MVNPIYQQGEELMLNPFGSKYLGVAAHTNVNSNEFIVQEDAIISVLTGGDSSIAANDVDYKASMSLSGVTLKQGALIVAPQGESFQSMTIDSGTIMAYNSVAGGTKPSSFVGLLDDYPNAAAAYSLRKLRTDYTGDAIEVRKTVASVTSTQDIGFDSNGDLDTAALLSFVGVGNDGFVSKWYDQSGEGNDATQTSASKQPKIVSSGVLNETDTKPSIAFNLDALVAGQDAIIDGGLAAFAVATTDAFGKYVPYAKAKAGAAPNRWGKYSQAFICIDSVGASRPINYNPSSDFGVNRITTQEIKNDPNALHEVFENGALVAAASTTSNPIVSNSFNLVIGVYNDSSGGGSATTYSHLGNISELVFYGTDQSANRTDIETNINDYYNVY